MPILGGNAAQGAKPIDLSSRLEEWRRLLLDTSKRSRLVNGKFGRGGILAVVHPEVQSLWEHFAINNSVAEFPWTSQWIDADADVSDGTEESGITRAPKGILTAEQQRIIRESPSFKSEWLLTDLPDRQLDNRLKRLKITASTSLSEQGVNSLFLAFGFLRWFEAADSEVPILSPLVLLPVDLRKHSADSSWVLAPLEDDIAPNHALAELLRSEFRLDLPELSEDALTESAEGLQSYLRDVEQAVKEHDRWQIDLSVGLGIFAFQKISMWEDLRKNESQITSNALCRGIAGDPSMMPSTDAFDVLNCDLDQVVSPETSYLVRDCDGSQLAAMEVVRKGCHLILDGPPGTGKSQTITNIIARCLADGKTILFVSEKAAALEVVKRRLDEAQLGEFCLECHSHKANKRLVIEELGRCLNRDTESYRSLDHEMTELRRTREKLNEYVRALHVKRSALELTVYGVHGRLARICTASTTRVTINDVHSINRKRFQEMEEAVGRLPLCAAIVAAKGVHPWRGCRTEMYSLTLPDDIKFHFTRVSTGLAQCLDAVTPLQRLSLVRQDARRADLVAAIGKIKYIFSFPQVPRRWIELGLAYTADSYIKLHELSKNHQILRTAASRYIDEAHLRADPSVGLSVADRSSKLHEALPNLPANAREQHAYLDTVASELVKFTVLAEKLETTIVEFSDLLGVMPRSSIDEVARLVSNVLLVVEKGCIRPEWFDKSIRKRLRQTAVDAKDTASLAVAMRTPLATKFLAPALSPVALDSINDLLRHQSWFRRIGGSWRRDKQTFGALYSGSPPSKGRHLLDDAHQLKRYHQLVAQLRKQLDQDSDALLWDGNLDFDWISIISDLDHIESLPDQIQGNQRFRSLLISADSTDRSRLTATAKVIDQNLKTLIATGKNAASATGNGKLIGSDFIALSVTDLHEKVAAIRDLCVQQTESLNSVIALLKDDHDVPVSDLKDDLKVLVELRDTIERARTITSALGETVPGDREPSLGNWEKPAAMAEKLKPLLGQFRDALPRPIGECLSDDATRAQLRAAFDRLKILNDPAMQTGEKFVQSLFDAQIEVSTGIILNQASIAQTVEWLSMRVRDAHRLNEWVNYSNACEGLRRCGLEVLLDEVLHDSIKPDDAINVWHQRFYRLWLEEAYRSEPVLATFDSAEHDHVVNRFQEMDRFSISTGYAQVRSKILSSNSRTAGTAGNAPDNSELGILLREVHKRRRHLPLRKLFASIPTLLMKLKPCVMMSPLAVSTYFDNGEIRFDVVIFDEASQVRPHDAVCAIYRGSQLVVAGDQKQLPPTNFFERFSDSEDDDDDDADYSTNDFESILDMCSTLKLPRQRLKWHYRSKRESLIAFSNKYFYDGELITFPSVRDVDGSSGVEFCFVENGRWAGGSSGGINEAEAERIAEMVMNHAVKCPEKSLGVITMNQAQMMRVHEQIDRRRRASLHLEQFFSNQNPEPFFVKNLENVQGDERDVIILGVGYAKSESGTLSHNFGPLNRQGGERRLNVAITRARESLKIFASIRCDDIDLSRTQAQGAKLLRAYLDFAERGRAALASTATEDGEHDFDSDFEMEVARALKDRGLQVHRQIGCSGFRIDLALVHPAHPGQYVLGVECDGATYHSSATARDRDRLRQEILENLGWKICRVWSTDWVRDPHRQIQKVLDLYERAVAAAATTEPPVELSPVLTPIKESAPPAAQLNNGFPEFNDIADVSGEFLYQALVGSIKSFGAMPLDDLIQAATRSLGFRRTGTRIRERVGREIRNFSRQGKLITGSDNLIRLAEPEV